MKTGKLIAIGAVIGGLAWFIRKSRMAPVGAPIANAGGGVSGLFTPLNSGIYNPIYNPGGATNYTGSYFGRTPATGYGWDNNWHPANA
jgi:hypothetical protein